MNILNAQTLPVIFIALMGFAILVYAILDGYDLGVGILLPLGTDDHVVRQQMIASIGPFWDANETWLVLAIGLLLIAFPAAHSTLFYELYIPTTVMLLGLIVRGVAFDFRTKAVKNHQHIWDLGFKAGSLLTTLAQGFMLGRYVSGFALSPAAYIFALLSAVGVSAAYAYIGGCWLILKTDAQLQRRAVAWARRAGRLSFIGVVLVSVTNPWLNPGVFDRWFSYPLVLFVLLIPTLCIMLYLANDMLLRHLPFSNDAYCAWPFMLAIGIFISCFIGIGFSFFPYIVPHRLTIWQAASAPESLRFIFYGAAVVVPAILCYTAFSYWVFRGKLKDLKYH